MTEIIIAKKQLFNPNGDDSIGVRRIIGGDSTNLLNLNDVKYGWATELYREMVGNFWLPEKIDLTKDKVQYRQSMNEHDQKAFDEIISFLTFLDSIQTNNLPNIFGYVTAPEVAVLGTIQAFQEAIHSQAYSYMFESILPPEKRKQVYYLWKDRPILLKRNKYIADIYQQFIDKPTPESFARALIANYILEGLYFYNGFNFFYGLEYRNIMIGASDNIRYINRDEGSHVELFKNMYFEVENEYPGLISKDMILEMFDWAVNEEINWTDSFLNNVLGYSTRNTVAYTKYMANFRISDIGIPAPYTGFNKNPYAHLEKSMGDKEGTTKSNFFENTVTEYSMASTLAGWDEI